MDAATKKYHKKSEEFRFGNYKNYYGKRLIHSDDHGDLRLKLLEAHPEYFKNKRVLDIGCNSGFLTINFARKLLPLSVMGIDIDGTLIEKARSDLARLKTDPTVTANEACALENVIFRKTNYILKDKTLLEIERPQYDCILCLSVTKWIHLNFGDDGIKFMFKRIYKQLNQNGILVLEAQPFQTYKKRSRMNQEILQNYKSIRLKPDDFEKYLLSDDIGFKDAWCIADEQLLKKANLPKGFQRPLQLFIKRTLVIR